MGSGVMLPDWMLQISYFGLIPWLVLATPVVLTLGRLPRLLTHDSIVQAHAAFILVQFIGFVNSATRFGVEGVVAGSYVLAVSLSFLYIYVLGLRLGEFSRQGLIDKTANRSMRILGWAMFPTILIALFQFVTRTGRDVDGVMRIFGGTSSPNVLGALLLVFLGMLAWSSRYRLGSNRVLLVSLCLALFIACFSMSGMVALVFAGMLYFVIRARSTGKLKIRFSWLMLGIIGVYILLALAGTVLSARFGELQQDDNSLMWRLRTWATYFELLSQPKFLLFGGGLGFDHLGMDQEPHNEWLRVLMETGLLGLSFFVLTWWRLVKALSQTIKLSDALLQRQAAGLAACLGGLLLWGTVDSVLRTAPSALLLWATSGLFIGLARSFGRHHALHAAAPSILHHQVTSPTMAQPV